MAHGGHYLRLTRSCDAVRHGGFVPRFFFHVFDDRVSHDEDGQIADDLEAARAMALNGARDLVCEQIHRGYLNLDNYIVIADKTGKELARVVFREAFVIQRQISLPDVD